MIKKTVIRIMLLMLPIGVQSVNYEVIPLPQSIQMQKGNPFVLDNKVEIVADKSLESEASFLQSYIHDITGITLTVKEKQQKGTPSITLSISSAIKESEGYILTVTQRSISIVGGSSSGVFYGIQTLRKSLVDIDSVSVSNTILLPPVIINDHPRFSWRGMHLDCSRHFFPVTFVKKYIDLLALHNMNVFHWHLTDDQGWRIEIKKWPKLIEIGSQRTGTTIGTNSDLDDEIPYGGYYTQAEARDIVSYAAKRHITVVPEIDMPGHMLAALASYPELGCSGGPYQVGHYWGVYKDVLCVSNPRVYQFIEDVLSELLDIFPSEVIHIGGDETPIEKWQQCAKCQQLATQIDGQTLQSYFTHRVFTILSNHHRRALGWDEILEGSPQDAMIMSWRGTSPGALAARTGHDVVMTPTSHCYFDYQQWEETAHEPSRCSGYIPIEQVYSLDPAPDSLDTEARQHILGVQANLWTEYITSSSLAEYQALPRLSALSEVQWTMPEQKDYENFFQRLTCLTGLYELYHYHYCKHLWPERQMPSRWQF